MVEKHYVAWWVGGVFTLLAFITTMFQIRLHIMWNQREKMRIHILRILMMVPMYALEAWMGLRFKETALYFDIMRECYEALVIYSFYMFLVECLDGEDHIRSVLRSKEQQMHIFPFNCLRPWKMGHEFFYLTKIGTLQYVVIKPILAVITFILKPLDKYNDGDFSADNGYAYIAFINNLTQIWAMYCLVLFYLATKDELKKFKPIPKFLCVKAVVFFTFWQSVGLAILVHFNIIHPTQTYSTENVVTGLQDLIICIEMFIAAIAHHFAFNYKELASNDNGPKKAAPFVRSFIKAVNVTDVYVGEVRKIIKERKRSNTISVSDDQKRHLLEDVNEEEVVFVAVNDNNTRTHRWNRISDKSSNSKTSETDNKSNDNTNIEL